MGSTSGRAFGVEDIRHLALERLQAAEHFQGSELVDFRLPHIVQCNSEAARALLQEKPYCRGPLISWNEQYRSRFLISIDGNGAACSRVLLGLRSQSVLMKYDSDHLLYYFPALQPWLHYPPIGTHADVETLIQRELAAPDSFRAVAEAGQRFARTSLTREAVTRYMAILLTEYATCLDDGEERSRMNFEIPEAPIQLVAHVQGLGDLGSDPLGWAGLPGSGKWIEGLTVLPGPAFRDAHITVQGLQRGDRLTPEAPAGAYCGTHGRGVPLLGLCVHLSGPASHRLSIALDAKFLDGTDRKSVPVGNLCRAASDAPLEAVRLTARQLP